ncbi:hypothetical protein CPAR01_01177 [Colletotrichum paranaense]|uniref:Uncharacterized protein n=1 Tax=Colletotrichum paranaense TaxID=1914294 RepID=A0ABQ9T625_9PEZI|nr:uncharacterized protein CPAR01_01177 [Colletotrichum paranaense]KAK1547210.1 hypothetical protein CPAR01_01177 [Colletotrichum paranaense]
MSDYHFEVGSDEAIMALGKGGIKQSFWMSHASLSPCFVRISTTSYAQPNSYSASYLVKVKAKRTRRSATPAASTGAWTLPRFGCLLTARKLMKRSQLKHSELSISQPLNKTPSFLSIDQGYCSRHSGSLHVDASYDIASRLTYACSQRYLSPPQSADRSSIMIIQ